MRFNELDGLDREILLRALRMASSTGLKSIEDRVTIMMDELDPNANHSVVLKSYPPSCKIRVIKEIRNEISGISLTDAKDLSENLPKTVLSGAGYSSAEAFGKILQNVGATVEVI